MAKKKSASKKANQQVRTEKSVWETEPIAWDWVPLASVLAVGLPFIGLAVWNRAQIATIKDTTQPVPNSKKNIRELWESIQAVRNDQSLQNALIDRNKVRMQKLEKRLEGLPNKEELQKTVIKLEDIAKRNIEIQKQVKADSEAVSATHRELKEQLDSPWYSIAAPAGTAVLWGIGAFTLSWPLSSYFFPARPYDPVYKKERFNIRFRASSVMGGMAALGAWLISGGPEGIGWENPLG